MKESRDKGSLNRSYASAKRIAGEGKSRGMDLTKAKWCTDCEEIYEGEACPRCGSTVYWWMSKMVRVVRRRPKRRLPVSLSGSISSGRRGPRGVPPSSTGADNMSARVPEVV